MIERYAGQPARLRIVVPRHPVDLAPVAGVVGFDGVVARIRCIDPPSTLFVMAPTALCGAFGSSLLGADVVKPFTDPAVHEAVITHLIADILRCLPSRLPLMRLDAVTFAVGAEVLPDVGRPAVIFVRVRLAGFTDLVTIVMPESSFLEMAADGMPGDAVVSPSVALDLRFGAAVVCGIAAVESEDLDRLEPGDVVLPDRMVSGAGPDGLRAGARCDLAVSSRCGQRFIASISVHGDLAHVESTGPLIMEGIMDRDDDHTVVDDARKAEPDGSRSRRAAVADLPAELVVEAGRASLSVREILALAPGTVIPLERSVSAEVTLTAGGRILAHGVLVDVEGEFGVQVLKVVR
ncbi:MAG: FliM/FliN family flagellar motor switch protein [Deltaproteobacteria bacterium]|nr:FliM/FliN family flagellar motor switch protein [Deltaproteobacteria bacterium]